MPTLVYRRVTSLGLQLGLYNVEWASDNAGCEAADGSGQGIKLRVGGRSGPSLQERCGACLVHGGAGGGGRGAKRV